MSFCQDVDINVSQTYDFQITEKSKWRQLTQADSEAVPVEKINCRKIIASCLKMTKFNLDNSLKSTFSAWLIYHRVFITHKIPNLSHVVREIRHTIRHTFAFFFFILYSSNG